MLCQILSTVLKVVHEWKNYQEKGKKLEETIKRIRNTIERRLTTKLHLAGRQKPHRNNMTD